MFSSTEIETAIVETFPVTCTLWRETELVFELETEGGETQQLFVEIVEGGFRQTRLGKIVKPTCVQDVINAFDWCISSGTETLYVVLKPGTLTDSQERKKTALQAWPELACQEEQTAPSLRCIDGRGFEAADLMHYRISKRLISKRSSASLKLVG